jgi:hypothetical protein
MFTSVEPSINRPEALQEASKASLRILALPINRNLANP